MGFAEVLKFPDLLCEIETHKCEVCHLLGRLITMLSYRQKQTNGWPVPGWAALLVSLRAWWEGQEAGR